MAATIVSVQADPEAIRVKAAQEGTRDYSLDAPWENWSCLGRREAEIQGQNFNLTDYLHKRDRVLKQNYLSFPEGDK